MTASRGVVFDIDGTVLADINSGLIPGAKRTLTFLAENNIPFVFVTNTTSKTDTQLAEMLCEAGLPTDRDRIITPVTAAKYHLRTAGHSSIMIVSCDALNPLFETEFTLSESPDAVILADDGSGISYADINNAFSAVMNGAELLTLQKNRFYARDDRLIADLGFYAAGMEYITRTEAVNTGKPSRIIFEVARKLLDLPSLHDLVMVGDDIEFDVLLPMELGVYGVLVKTGKYRPGQDKHFNDTPDLAIDSIAELPRHLDTT